MPSIRLVVSMILLVVLCSLSGQAADPQKVHHEAVQLEKQLDLTRAAALYEEIVRACPERRLSIGACQGLQRIEDLRSEFSLDRSELQQRLAKTYRPFQPQELNDWERRGWIYSRLVDGRKRYSVGNVTNIRFFSTELMARNPQAAKDYRKFADIFLAESARLDRLRAASPISASYVDPVPFISSPSATTWPRT